MSWEGVGRLKYPPEGTMFTQQIIDLK